MFFSMAIVAKKNTIKKPIKIVRVVVKTLSRFPTTFTEKS